MKEWFSASQLAGLPGMPGTERGVNKRAAKDGWLSQPKPKGQGKGRLYRLESLPDATQAALVMNHQKKTTEKTTPTFEASDAAAAWDQYERVPQSTKDEAKRRTQILQTIRHYIEDGWPKGDAVKHVSQMCGDSEATIRRWQRQVRHAQPCDWMPLLVPRWTGRTAYAECSVEAWDFFKADYLRPEQPAASACYERLQVAADEHGWTIPSSCKSLVRRLDREIPSQVIKLAREGVDALRFSTPQQERDRSHLHAMEALNADGHKFDVFVRWPDGEVVRPMMICWQDLYSGKLLSYRIDKTENRDAIRLAFGDVAETYGVPNEVYLDNGRGFASKTLTGGTPNRFRFKVKEEDPVGTLNALGVRVHWVLPHRGQSKPIERAFRDLAEHVSKDPRLSGAYTGKKPDAKPENYGSRAVDLDTFLEVLEENIARHNAREGRRSHTCQGRSFDQTFAASYEQAVVRWPSVTDRRLYLLAAEGVRTNRLDGSVRLQTGGNRYWCEEMSAFAGQSVVIRFDPAQLHEAVYVYELSGRYIGQADCVARVGFDDAEAAREHARLQKQHRKATRERLNRERRMDELEISKLMPSKQAEEEAPEPAAKRLVRPVRAIGNTAVQADDEEQQQPSADQQAFEEDFQGVASIFEERLRRKGKSQL